MSELAFAGGCVDRGELRSLELPVARGRLAVLLAAIVLLVVSSSPLSRGLGIPSSAGSHAQAHPASASATRAASSASRASSKSIPEGLQKAIHSALGPGPVGLGAAPLVAGIDATSSGFKAAALGGTLSATLSKAGSLSVGIRNGGTSLEGSFTARAVSAGAGSKPVTLSATSSSLEHGRLVQRMGLVSTRYKVVPAGLEQGFEVLRPPSTVSHELLIDLGPSAGWQISSAGTSLVEGGRAGSTALDYGDLRTVDSKGAVVPSRFRIVGGTAQILVHLASRTVFPLTVDPTWSSSSAPTAILTHSGGSGGDLLGYSVAISADGTTALVGAYGVNSNKGAVYIFHVAGAGSWSSTSAPTAILTNSGGSGGDDFGYSVAISADGTTALIGARGVVSAEGAAYVFHATGEASWSSSSTPEATLTNSGASADDEFGCSVAISADGTTALVGARFATPDLTYPYSGGAYVFHAPSEGSWSSSSSPNATLLDFVSTGIFPSSADLFGYSVAISADGTTALVGAPGGGSGKGFLLVFHVSSEGTWSGPTDATTQIDFGSIGDEFGSSVAISADGATALVGAVGVNGETGAAYVFHVSGEGTWSGTHTPEATLEIASYGGGAFGNSVALSADGSVALVGAPNVSPYPSELVGSAYVFTSSAAGSWSGSPSPAATLTNSAESSFSYLGFSVAISADGTTALVGSQEANASYVFNVPGAQWSSVSAPAGTQSNSAGSNGDSLGYSVAMSADGTTALVGAPDTNSSRGAAYVFHVSSENSWSVSLSTPTATLTDSSGSTGDELGYSVAISADGTTALLGAIGGNGVKGAAYVFHVSGEGSWSSSSIPAAALTDSSGSTGDELGHAVALSADGTTALVGAPGVTSFTGSAYVFQASGEASWSNLSSPTATLSNGGSNGDNFGYSVAISADGTTALVGAYGASTDKGAAYVFHMSGEGSWSSSSSPTAALTNSTGSSGDSLGWSVAMSADGTTALVGAYGVSSGKGAAYVFHASGEGSWSSSSSPTATLSNSGGSNQDDFGQSVALTSAATTALVGAFGVSSSTGAAYMFQVAGEGSWTTTSSPSATLTDYAGVAGDLFGNSVAISSDATTALVGAPGVNSSTGAAYVFSTLLPAFTIVKSDNAGGSSNPFTAGAALTGSPITYSVVVQNVAPVSGAGTVSDALPSDLTGGTWTTAVTNGASATTTSGTGSITDDPVTLPANSSVTFVVDATVSTSASGTMSNTATLVPSSGGSLSATDTDNVTGPSYTLSKTDDHGGSSVIPQIGTVLTGDAIKYSVTITNGAAAGEGTGTLSDPLSTYLTGATWTAASTGGASATTTSGTGPISDDPVTMPANSSVTFTITATVSLAAPATISNTATLTPDSGSPMSATDTDNVTGPVFSLSKSDDDGGSSVTPSTGTALAGSTITYSVVVSNSAGAGAGVASLSDPLPPSVTGATWSTNGTNGATATTPSGTGSITNDQVTMPTNSTLTFTITGTVSTSASGTISNTATLTPSGPPISATDSDNVSHGGPHFVVLGSSPALGLSPIQVTVEALNPNGSLDTAFSGTVTFVSTDLSSTLPAPSTLTSGKGTFPVIFRTAGNQTLSALSNLAITGSKTFYVELPYLTVSVPTYATTGSPFQFKVTAVNPIYGSTDTTFPDTVHFTTTDGSGGVSLPADSTLTNGVGTFSATLETPGNQTITATDNSISGITRISSAIQVSYPYFTLSVPSGANPGHSFSFTVTARNRVGSAVDTLYGGTVHFTSTDGSAALPADSTLTKGVGTFTATLETVGYQTITATDAATSAITDTSGKIYVP